MFKTLKTPVKFDAGVDLSVVAWGFSKDQMNGNFYLAPYNGKGNPPWTTNGNGDTNGWIGYDGTGRYIDKPGVFPPTSTRTSPALLTLTLPEHSCGSKARSARQSHRAWCSV